SFVEWQSCWKEVAEFRRCTRAILRSRVHSRFGIRSAKRMVRKQSRCAYSNLDQEHRRDLATANLTKFCICWTNRVNARSSSMGTFMTLDHKPVFTYDRDRHSL